MSVVYSHGRDCIVVSSTVGTSLVGWWRMVDRSSIFLRSVSAECSAVTEILRIVW